MLIDTHNHTMPFSPDANMTILELIEMANAMHLGVVASTPHYEYDNPDPNDNIQTFDLKEYSSAFEGWKQLCPPELTLLKGIEFGYQKHTASVIDRIAQEADLDIVLLSNHLFRGRDVYYSQELPFLPKTLRHREYITTLAEMVENANNFDVATHFDYINKFCSDSSADLLYEDCPEAFDRFFEALIYKGKALELNTSSSMRRHAMPDTAILQRYLDMGGELFALASDAHVKENVGAGISQFAALLQSLGVREVCYFQKRQIKMVTLP